jgi:hypothetical protein
MTLRRPFMARSESDEAFPVGGGTRWVAGESEMVTTVSKAVLA